MRTRCAGALTVMLVGSSCYVSPHSAAKFKSAIAAKTAKPAVHVRDKTAVKTAASSVAPAKVAPAAPAQPSETPDPVIGKAKITIAAKLPDPASAEFGEMKRAMQRNPLDQSVATICGRVEAANVSNEAAADRPFLYLVKDDEAYVVDGPPGSAAATAYRNIAGRTHRVSSSPGERLVSEFSFYSSSS